MKIIAKDKVLEEIDDELVKYLVIKSAKTGKSTYQGRRTEILLAIPGEKPILLQKLTGRWVISQKTDDAIYLS